MQSIADALVYAVTYINLREGGDDQDDVGALESIAAKLASATDEEKDALATAAEKALREELKRAPRDEFVGDYRSWMEDLFGEEWTRNKRNEQ